MKGSSLAQSVRLVELDAVGVTVRLSVKIESHPVSKELNVMFWLPAALKVSPFQL